MMLRESKSRSALSGLTCVLMIAAISARTDADEPQGDANPPNIVFFLSDDQRHDQMGCAGHAVLNTPTLDRLARDGVRFTHAFVTTSICAASRASILTGQVERTHGYTFRRPPLSKQIAERTYPSLLRKAGYRTGFVGKLGVNFEKGSHALMFDQIRILSRSPYFKPQPNGEQRHITDLCADFAVDFIQQVHQDQRPFCLSVSFNAPHAEDSDKNDHYPYPPSANELYSDLEMPRPRLDNPSIFDSQPDFLQNSMNRIRWFWRWDTPEKYQKNIRNYYRMISGIDHAMGRVLDELTRLDLDDDTVIVFTGDNGYYLGDRGFAGKWSHYEESLRVPLIILDPREPSGEQNRTNRSMVLNVDIAPTILEFAKVDARKDHQGQSLAPLVDGTRQSPWRTDFFCEHLMQHKEIPKWEGVRGSRFVYARYFDQQPAFEFLHDLESDPDQLKNLAQDARFAEQLNRMRRRCDELRDQYGGTFSEEKYPVIGR